MKRLAIIIGALVMAGSAQAADLVKKNSPHSVAETMDRFAAAVENAGAGIAARVDHQAAAKKVGIDIAANQVLIFGNPKLGSPIFAENPAAGLDLPMRVVVFDDGGQTVIAYRAPSALVAAHDLPADLAPLSKMTGALDKLTDAAIAE